MVDMYGLCSSMGRLTSLVKKSISTDSDFLRHLTIGVVSMTSPIDDSRMISTLKL